MALLQSNPETLASFCLLQRRRNFIKLCCMSLNRNCILVQINIHHPPYANELYTLCLYDKLLLFWLTKHTAHYPVYFTACLVHPALPIGHLPDFTFSHFALRNIWQITPMNTSLTHSTPRICHKSFALKWLHQCKLKMSPCLLSSVIAVNSWYHSIFTGSPIYKWPVPNSNAELLRKYTLLQDQNAYLWLPSTHPNSHWMTQPL